MLSYRVGYQSAYDLRVYDNAPIGVRHPNVICDACRKHGIIGMRWKCARCFDFDLCTHCYMALDKHDLTHPFLRFETATNTQVNTDQIIIIYFIFVFNLRVLKFHLEVKVLMHVLLQKAYLKVLLLYEVLIGIGVIKMVVLVDKEKFKKSRAGKTSLVEVLLRLHGYIIHMLLMFIVLDIKEKLI